MLTFFIIFLVVGLILGVIVEDTKIAAILIIIISITWAFIFGPWAFLTFLEVTLGYLFARKLK